MNGNCALFFSSYCRSDVAIYPSIHEVIIKCDFSPTKWHTSAIKWHLPNHTHFFFFFIIIAMETSGAYTLLNATHPFIHSFNRSFFLSFFPVHTSIEIMYVEDIINLLCMTVNALQTKCEKKFKANKAIEGSCGNGLLGLQSETFMA